MTDGGISFNRKPGSGKGPPGGPPPGAGGGGGGGGAGGPVGGGDKPEFELIRTAGGGGGGSADAPPMGLILIVVIAALVGGGYFMFGRGEGGGETAGETKTEAVTTTAPKDVEVPSAILDQIDVKFELDAEAGLALAEEKLEQYPSNEIRERITRFRKELGLGLSADDLLKQVEALANQKQWTDAIAKADQVIANEEENKAIENARAYYLRGACKGFSGERSAAVEDLKNAIELGFEPKSQAEKLVKQWSN